MALITWLFCGSGTTKSRSPGCVVPGSSAFTRRWRLSHAFSDLPRRHALHVEFADALLHLHGELPRLVLRGGGGVRRDLRAVRRQGGGGGGDLASFSAAVSKRL